jgi:polar amino acid transport system substrate-binding protein
MKKCFLVFLLLTVFGCGKKSLDYGPYSIGRDETWFPLQIGLRGPSLIGFTNAMIQEIAASEDVPLTIVDTNWAQLFQGLEEGEVAGIFTSLSPNTISNEKYSFSDPFLLLGPVLVVPIESSATSLTDLEGKVVAVNKFDESVLLVQRYPSIIIKLYENQAIALENLVEGQYDGLLIPVLDAQDLVPQHHASQLKIVTEPTNNNGRFKCPLVTKF